MAIKSFRSKFPTKKNAVRTVKHLRRATPPGTVSHVIKKNPKGGWWVISKKI